MIKITITVIAGLILLFASGFIISSILAFIFVTHKPSGYNMSTYKDVLSRRPDEIKVIMLNGKIYVFDNVSQKEIILSRIDQFKLYIYSLDI